jgi:hypothetical protein
MSGTPPQADRGRRPPQDGDPEREREETAVNSYPNPGLEAELAYRREVLQALGQRTRTRRGPWRVPRLRRPL